MPYRVDIGSGTGDPDAMASYLGQSMSAHNGDCVQVGSTEAEPNPR